MLLKTLPVHCVRKKLPRFLELIGQLKDCPLRTLAKTLTSWLEPIVDGMELLIGFNKCHPRNWVEPEESLTLLIG